MGKALQCLNPVLETNFLHIAILGHRWDKGTPVRVLRINKMKSGTWLLMLSDAAGSDNVCDDLGRDVLCGKRVS